MSLIVCRDLCLGYEGKELIRRLNFKIEPGDYLCVLGENGSGKSTLMRTLLGLLPPVSGQILRGDGLSANGIGYLPQQTAVQRDFPATVREVVLSGCQGGCGLRPYYRKEEKQRADAAMEKMGIAPLAGRCYRELSGGQQQRVLLSRALCATKTMLLLDEPVTGLDPRATDDLYRLIASLHRDGIAVVMITHDTGAALTYATHILHLGKEVFFGTREAYTESEIGQSFVRRQKKEEADRGTV